MLRKEFNFASEFPAPQPSNWAWRPGGQKTSTVVRSVQAGNQRDATPRLPLRTPETLAVPATNIRLSKDRPALAITDEAWRASVVAAARGALSENAPFLDIVTITQLTIDISSAFAAQSENRASKHGLQASDLKIIKALALDKLIQLELLLPKKVHHAILPSLDQSLPAKNVSLASERPVLHVVVTRPTFREDGTVAIFASVKGAEGASVQWSLSKGNLISHSPVTLQTMCDLGVAKVGTVMGHADAHTVVLELGRGVLEPGTQYTVFVNCSTSNASATDSLTFLV